MQSFLRYARRNGSLLGGFTLVETLVSTMIISLVIIGPLTLASNAAIYARTTKDSLIASYLAQEAMELLRYQQDSVYIACIQSSSFSCVATGTETTKETAWRIFKERLGDNPSGASCFDTDNALGCAYDFIDMVSNPDATPDKYAFSQPQCNTLAIELATNIYVCSGARGSGAGFAPTYFSRSVVIESIPTFSGSDAAYNDDLRVTVTVTFRRPSGFQHSIRAVDFMHARS